MIFTESSFPSWCDKSSPKEAADGRAQVCVFTTVVRVPNLPAKSRNAAKICDWVSSLGSCTTVALPCLFWGMSEREDLVELLRVQSLLRLQVYSSTKGGFGSYFLPITSWVSDSLHPFL